MFSVLHLNKNSRISNWVTVNVNTFPHKNTHSEKLKKQERNTIRQGHSTTLTHATNRTGRNWWETTENSNSICLLLSFSRNASLLCYHFCPVTDIALWLVQLWWCCKASVILYCIDINTLIIFHTKTNTGTHQLMVHPSWSTPVT